MQRAKNYCPPIEEFFFLKLKNIWTFLKGEHFSFIMICCYLFFEYARPQAIFPVIDFLPWAQLFLIGSLAGAVVDRSVKWVSSPINIFLILFAIIIFIASLNAIYPKISEERYIDFYSWFVVYFLIINIVNTKQRFYVFLLIFMLCAAKISISLSQTWAFRGFSFTAWGLKGPRGYFQNSGELSILMLTLFPVAYHLYQLLKDKVSRVEKYILILFWVTPILVVLGASSRGSQLALAIQLMIIFRKYIFRIKPLIMVVSLCVLLYHLLPEEQKQRFEEAGTDKTSQQRLLYFQNGWEMMQKYPMLGVGYFNFPKYFEDYYPEDMLYEKAELPHNIFIQVGTDTGFTGLAIFMFLLLLPFWLSRRKKIDPEKDPFMSASITGVLQGIIGFIIAGQFVTVTYYPFLWVGLAFVVAGNNVYNLQHNQKARKDLFMENKFEQHEEPHFGSR